jgi:hypothetical protein
MAERSPETLLSDVAERISRLGHSGSSRFFLYLETEEGMQSPYLFQEFTDEAQAIPLSGVTALLYELWENASPQRWGAMRFDLDGDKFSATFDYDIDAQDGHTDERAQAAAKTRFGEKPIVYPTHDEWVQEHIRQSRMFD